MAEKLGALLLREGIITAIDLEEGLKAQQIYGARLGTNLVETGDLDIEVLAKKLGQQRGFPVATVAEMEAATSSTLALLSAELAKKHQALPLAQEGRRLKVAMAAPYDPEHLDGVGFAVGLRLVPSIVPELRLFHQHEKRYGIKRDERYIRLASEEGDLPPGVARERRRFAPKTTHRPPVALGEEISLEQLFGKPAPVAPADVHTAVTQARTAVTRAPVAPASALSPAAFEGAPSEGAVAKALLDFCAGRFRRAFLFVEATGTAVVGRAVGAGSERPAARALRINLRQPSCLTVAASTEGPYRLPAGADGQDGALLAALAEPGWTAVATSLRRKHPSRLFVVALSDAAPDAKLLGELGQAVALADAAFARLAGAPRSP
ncbi:MAG: GspE/PulE/PilB domain-containing protein [Myxococcaceae bacterium]